MKIQFSGLCSVCGKTKNKSLPTHMQCRCKGLIMDGKCRPMPKGGFRVVKGKVKSISSVKQMRARRAEEWLAKQKGVQDEAKTENEADS